MRVLITSIGSNTAIGVAKQLAKAEVNEEVILYGTDLNRRYECAGVPFVDHFIQLPTAFNEIEYKTALVALVKTHGIDCVIPIHDKEIEVIARLSLEYPSLTYWAVNTPQVIEICNNKLLANDFVAKLHLAVPKFVSDFSLANELNYPVIKKPVTGVSSAGIEIFNEPDKLQHLEKTEGSFLQELVTGGREYTVDCYSTKGVFYAGLSRLRDETKSGISTKGTSVDCPAIINICRTILEGLEYSGVSNLQFIEKDREFYFIEINPRFSGAGVLSYKSNLDTPLYTILEAQGKRLPPQPSITYGIKMTRFWDETFFDAQGNII